MPLPRPLPLCAAACGLVLLLAWCAPVDARTVWRCVRDGTVSMATAPEPGSQCEAHEIEGDPIQTPNLWGAMGEVNGTLYEVEVDGELVYTTRELPGARPYLRFTVQTPPGEPAHAGLGRLGPPQLRAFADEFRAAAKSTGLDEAWLRAVAHAESGFDADAVSPKGAAGVMQLMPDVIADYGVEDPFSAGQSIRAGARYLRDLVRRYRGDELLALAAYNAGIGTVARYGGVPPYAETKTYIGKVQALHRRYRQAMGKGAARPAQ